MTKRENVLEKCRINLDKEKVLHSITRGEKEELQERIDKAIDYIVAKAHHGDCIIPLTILELKNKDYYKLIEILKGEDK